MFPWNIPHSGKTPKLKSLVNLILDFEPGSPIWNPRKDFAWFVGTKDQKSDKIWRFDPSNNEMKLFGHLSEARY